MAYHEDREKKMYGGMRKPSKRGGYAMGRMPMKHGGMHDYGSVRDLEKACRGDVGYNESLKSKEDK
jgi:hypothetical protein